MFRLEHFKKQIAKHNAEAMLVTDPKNIFYISGFLGISPNERESVLLITKQSAFLYVPRMYELKAKHDVYQGVEVVSNLINGLLASFAEKLLPNSKILCEAHNVTLAEKNYIEDKTKLTLQPSSKIISSLRLIKDELEILSLKKSGNITDKVFTHIQSYIAKHWQDGLYEKDIVNELRRFSESIGSEGFGFEPIVALGKGSAEPHYITKNRPLKTGQPLLIDMGFVVNGYTSDFTRTLFLGTADELFKKHYNLVLSTQEKCVAAVKPGINTGDLYKISADEFNKAGVLDRYLHSLGHGVGLNIHESPSISPSSNDVLAPGMIITIEPGIYFDNKYGIRIEDLLLVTKDGSELLTKSPKKLIELSL